MASKVEAKPNIASLLKLRWGSSQNRRIDCTIGGTHPNNLVELEGAHLVAVEVGAGPFWVEHFVTTD